MSHSDDRTLIFIQSIGSTIAAGTSSCNFDHSRAIPGTCAAPTMATTLMGGAVETDDAPPASASPRSACADNALHNAA